jgi:hypothetical protein
MKPLDGHESLVLQEEGMSDQQKRLVKKSFFGEIGLIWGSVVGPPGTIGGGFGVPVSE